MQARLLTLVLMAISLTAFPQGKVTFGNDSTRLFVLHGGFFGQGDPDGPIPSSPLPSGRTLAALLYAGTTSASLILQTAIPLTGTDWLSLGRMASRSMTLNSVPGGGMAYFQIFLADTGGVMPTTIPGGYFDYRAFSFSGGVYLGTSGLFTAVPGTSLTYPYLGGGPASSTWPVGNIDTLIPLFPEPSGFALLGLGLAVLAVQHRRPRKGTGLVKRLSLLTEAG